MCISLRFLKPWDLLHVFSLPASTPNPSREYMTPGAKGPGQGEMGGSVTPLDTLRYPLAALQSHFGLCAPRCLGTRHAFEWEGCQTDGSCGWQSAFLLTGLQHRGKSPGEGADAASDALSAPAPLSCCIAAQRERACGSRR